MIPATASRNDSVSIVCTWDTDGVNATGGSGVLSEPETVVSVSPAVGVGFIIV